MRYVVGVADMRICTEVGDIIVTHALGSCLGITAHDPVVHVGGMLHVMLPSASINPDKARLNPYMFVDTGVPAFFRDLYAHGAVKSRLIVKVAGGANVHGNPGDHFAIGKRNHIQLRKLFWTNGVMIKSEDVGGDCARTMYLDIGNGRVWLSIGGVDKDL